ncbi:MAG TPA: lamin tail domain-containing protein, partial [Patescibacteria group bacterium]|nr:lamin tail domain-containing protein [Patescibacteria group bacterium]
RIWDLRTSVLLPDITFPPRGFVLLTRDSAALRESRFIPSGVRLIEVKLPSLNNTTDAVALKTTDSVIIDSLFYNTKWGFKGISLERRDFRILATSQQNISASVAPDSATAGLPNSIAVLDNDLAVRTLQFDNVLNTLKIVIFNVGLLRNSVVELRISADINRDSSFTQNEVFKTFPVGILQPNDSAVFEVFKSEIEDLRLASGATLFQAEIAMPNDERAQNNLLKTPVYSAFKNGAILINEIMFDPLAGWSEFVELYNTTSDTLLLNNWILSDGKVSFTIGFLKIAPDNYGIIVTDSTFFQQFPLLIDMPNVYVFKNSLNFNAMSDSVLLKDGGGTTIDSMGYQSHWHESSLSMTKGISLEKISPLLPSDLPSSWTSSTATTGATPGERNSIAVAFKDAGGELSATPNPFSPRGSEQFTIISYGLPFTQARTDISVFDLNGVKVRTVASAIYSGASGSMAWDGKNDAGFDLPKGAYVVFLEAADVAGTDVFQKKIVVAISK